MSNLGVWSLLPVAVLLLLIFTTRRTLLALTAATLTGAVLIGSWGFAEVWLEKIQSAFAGGTTGYLILLLVLFGIQIQLLDKSNAAIEFANWLSRYANTRRKAMFLTFLIGWIIFVDDYLNNMAVSAAMKRVCDRHKVPRTLFGFLVNCTAAPVCVLIPVSTWAIFYGGLFEQYGVCVDGSGMKAYCAGIPFLFYAWVLLAICLLVISGVFPPLGITRGDNRLAMETGVVCSAERSCDGADIRFDSNAENAASAGKNPLRFLLPMVAIVSITIITSNVMIACMGAIFVTVLVILTGKSMTLPEIFDAAYGGVCSMIQISCVIVLALTLVEINTATGMSEFAVSLLVPLLSKRTLSAFVFAFCSLYSFSAGGFWDGSMIFMSIVVPVAAALEVNPLLPCMALVCAATAGSTTYVAGDAVMITSRAVDIKPYYQMLGTLPYAAVSYVLTIVLFLIAGFFV